MNKLWLIGILLLLYSALPAQDTELIYLSGQGKDNTVDWEFYCTEGMRSGTWSVIPVPSNWELLGFGNYDYGLVKDSIRGKEKGFYRYRFQLPESWKNKTIKIVFEGSMTDTEVKVNGVSAGPVHQGAFYRFSYPVTGLVTFEGDNLLEVTVSKHSANNSVNKAERFADYWIFGGIFRPVYLEAVPHEHINRVAINALANGDFTADVYCEGITNSMEIIAGIYTLEGVPVSDPFKAEIRKSEKKVTLQTKVPLPAVWSPETPNLYQVRFTLSKKGKANHIYTERFGFRTVEFRERDGIYLNGAKIKFKGVCRHSFWPESGRTMSKDRSIEDVLAMKDMNMNAVRNSHYPADRHFYEACDSLGLMVLDELGGWHDAYDTDVGSVLVTEMIEYNMNHPSVVMWVNGNEGGHNRQLLKFYDSLDIQQRPVIQAWETFRGTDTQHYTNYDYGAGTHFHGHAIVFPTEFLHGLYDGGLGAGLHDYWEYMWNLPLSAGGFLWDFADEGVVRTDLDGHIDTDGDHGADGIVGPFHEKEGSYYTIKEVWSPVYFEPKEITSSFDGSLSLVNRYMFTNTGDCRFRWILSGLFGPWDTSGEQVEGWAESPDIKPGQKGILSLNLPDNWQKYDVLYIEVKDPKGHVLFRYSFPITLPEKMASKIVDHEGPYEALVEEDSTLLIVSTGEVRIKIDRKTGWIDEVSTPKGVIPLTEGPVLCDGETDLLGIDYRYDNESLKLNYVFGDKSNFKSLQWTIFPSGWIKLDVAYRPQDYLSDFMGINFSFPEDKIKAVKWMGDGPYRVWKNRMRGNRLDVWEKSFNNTITGVSGFVYPEFKGYHSRLYWARLYMEEQSFVVVSADEDIFLRLLTPEFPQTSYNTAPAFPKGNLSFLQAIPPMGTKSQIPENMGPSGKKNMYFDYWKARAKEMTIYFSFFGE